MNVSRRLFTYGSPSSRIILTRSPRKGGFPIITSVSGHSASVPSLFKKRVTVFNTLQRLQDGFAAHVEPVFPHPLNPANPDGDAGQLGSVGIYLDAVHGLLAPTDGKLSSEAHGLGL